LAALDKGIARRVKETVERLAPGGHTIAKRAALAFLRSSSASESAPNESKYRATSLQLRNRRLGTT
jgi:hypothetical protein